LGIENSCVFHFHSFFQRPAPPCVLRELSLAPLAALLRARSGRPRGDLMASLPRCVRGAGLRSPIVIFRPAAGLFWMTERFENTLVTHPLRAAFDFDHVFGVSLCRRAIRSVHAWAPDERFVTEALLKLPVSPLLEIFLANVSQSLRPFSRRLRSHPSRPLSQPPLRLLPDFPYGLPPIDGSGFYFIVGRLLSGLPFPVRLPARPLIRHRFLLSPGRPNAAFPSFSSASSVVLDFFCLGRPASRIPTF